VARIEDARRVRGSRSRCARGYPHPALRATFSRKGRRERDIAAGTV
jgi:hypothetical protein